MAEFNKQLMNLPDDELKRKQQTIIHNLGGFRKILMDTFSNGTLLISQSDTQKLSLRQLLTPMNPCRKAIINHLANIVLNSSWKYYPHLIQLSNDNKLNVSLEESIAKIIFDFAAKYNMWVFPTQFGTCDEFKISFNSSREYRTAYTANIINSDIIGKYECDIKILTNCTEIYIGILDANATKKGHQTCIGYTPQLNNGYAYSFDRGGLYHKENRNPIGGAYNQNYSIKTATQNDIVNVYVRIEDNLSGILEFGINNKKIGNEIKIDVPKCGFRYGISVGFSKAKFEMTNILFPNKQVQSSL